MTLKAREKLAYDAYRVGLHVPDRHLDRGDRVTVFGVLRRRGFTARRDGWVRIVWTDAAGTEHVSRSQYIEVNDGRGRD